MEYKLTFQQYQEALGAGKYLGLKCNSCGAHTFPPQGVCRGCGGHDLSVAEMQGQGTIKTYTVIRVAPEGMKPPYIVAIVELDEGSSAMGNLVGVKPDEADMSLVGRRVKLGSRCIKDDPDTGEETRSLSFELI
jgi:uncharacterized OB-fold protein